MAIVKRSVVIKGRKTSISLEDEFWTGLKVVAAAHDATISDTIAAIETARGPRDNLSSAVRLVVLAHYRDAVMR